MLYCTSLHSLLSNVNKNKLNVNLMCVFIGVKSSWALPGSNVKRAVDFKDGLNVERLLAGVRAMGPSHKHWISFHH